jgi:hypothetical protein
VSYNFLPMERSREALLPTTMWEWLPRDHFAYFVAEFADTLEFVVAAADVPREGAGARRGGAGRTEALSVVTSTGRRPWVSARTKKRRAAAWSRRSLARTSMTWPCWSTAR